MPTKLLSDDALGEIEARANVATNPPWDAQSIEMSLEADRWMRGDNNHNDALFMAHAREDIPALCQTVRDLREQLAQTRRHLTNTEEIRQGLKKLAGEYENEISKLKLTRNELQSKLAQVTQERQLCLQVQKRGIHSSVTCPCVIAMEASDESPQH